MDSAVSDGQVLIMRSATKRENAIPVYVHQGEDGGLEQAFRGAGWDLHTPAPEGWACTPAPVATAMAKLGCAILGPPPGSAGDNPIPTQIQS